MTGSTLLLKTSLVQRCLSWFKDELRQKLFSPIETAFPNFPLTGEVLATQRRLEQLLHTIGPIQQDKLDLINLFQNREWSADPHIGSLFKQSILLYRRYRAGYLEGLRTKTFDLEINNLLRQEIDELDAAANHDWFQSIEQKRLPKLKEFLSLPLIESLGGLPSLLSREFDEKFRVLCAPTLFLHDLALFRAKYEARDTPVAIAFLDIDNFKSFNEKYTETFVDRSLLPRLMQAIEAHVHDHGYAYRQGGDEYLILLPNLSRRMTIVFLDELRRKLADLEYPGIQEKTTLSIGICIADPDCPLTDQELLIRANEAKKVAKSRKNCLATYQGPRLIPEELEIVEVV